MRLNHFEVGDSELLSECSTTALAFKSSASNKNLLLRMTFFALLVNSLKIKDGVLSRYKWAVI